MINLLCRAVDIASLRYPRRLTEMKRRLPINSSHKWTFLCISCRALRVVVQIGTQDVPLKEFKTQGILWFLRHGRAYGCGKINLKELSSSFQRHEKSLRALSLQLDSCPFTHLIIGCGGDGRFPSFEQQNTVVPRWYGVPW